MAPCSTRGAAPSDRDAPGDDRRRRPRHAEFKRPIDYPGNALGSGSDYTVFLNFLGLPVVEMSFSGPYGVYHSTYDNYYWMTQFGDPGFKYMTAMGEVWGRMAMRLANAQVLPFDFSRYAVLVGQFLDELGGVPGVGDRLDLSAARADQMKWKAAAGDLEIALRRWLETDDLAGRDRLNQALRAIEQAWLLPEGIPGRPWFRHALYAPKYTYAAMELPGVREAVDQGDWATAVREMGRLTERISAVAEAVRAAAGPRPVQSTCEFIVYNRTPLALEIRMRVRAASTAPIGSLNPGELMTHSVPCAERSVWIAGVEIPPWIGAPTRFGVLQGSADLVAGERVQIDLHWP